MKNDSPVVDDKFSLRDELDLSGAEWKSLPGATLGAPATVEYAFVTHGDVTSVTPVTYVLLRQHTSDGPTVLVFTPSEWDAFLLGARDGEFDRPE
ncbi:DUF397 domain-containing protein [Saccharomonospora piscinae]|uniref:DUF397 domain-containing protein n=1 Tax=Saccharomonospora piscinae TaxID=687388 RepID=A0A1V8ZYQ2_SACPI|nr:DUF397 domain-containing protein [Saccharomonospora piscinae]OQO90012.1 DUF397 domain-containing protein [Saccharomonospora piscinae]